MELREVISGIWTAEHVVRFPFGVGLPTRMTLVDLGESGLFLHSPIPIDDDLDEEIHERGEVEWIVAPNDHHHLYVEQAAERFPDAQVLGSGGARKNEPQVDFDGALEEGAPEAWSGRIEMRRLDGTRMWNESVFFVPEQRTLICSDLVFNVQEVPNFATSLFLTLTGAKRRFVQTRTTRWFLVKDRERFGRSMQKILEWDIERIIMGHGRIVESDGRKKLAEAARWALPDSPQIESRG